MKKIVFLLLFIFGSLTFAFESHSLEFKKQIYDMITQIESAPENPKNRDKWQKNLRFTIEDEDVTVYLNNFVLGDKEKDKIDDDTNSILLMSYTMGALKEQLISKKELTEVESTTNGLKATLKTYNRLKKTRDINIEYYEILNKLGLD